MQGQEDPDSSELTNIALPANEHCSIIASILADCRTAYQRGAITRALCCLDKAAPGKLDQLDAAIRRHLPKHHQKPLMRDYLTMTATVKRRINLDDAIRFVCTIDPTDDMWN